MGNELVVTYFIDGKKYNVFGCWDKETPENEFDFMMCIMKKVLVSMRVSHFGQFQVEKN